MTARSAERTLAACLLALVVASGTAAQSCAVAALCLPLCARNASGRRALRRRLVALLPLLGGLGLAYSLASLAAPSGSAQLSSRFGLIAARVSSAALLLALITHDLRPSHLARALRALHLPESLVELILATHAYASQLLATLQAAWAASVLRGGLSSLTALRHTIGSVAGVVILRSIDRSERVAVAAALRGAGSAGAPGPAALSCELEEP